MLRTCLLLIALVFGLAARAENAAPPPEARALIERQLDAFAHDDAAGAYELASPTIQTMFKDPDTFMAMVRKSYAPVYRHRSVEYGAFIAEPDSVDQILTIVDDDNEVWKAIFRLQKQPDGNWRTIGCVLFKAAESAL